MSAEHLDGGDEHECHRVLWRSRRGMLELDLLLVEFARERYPRLPASQREAYRQLLDAEDALIWDWLQCRVTPPSRLTSVVESIIAFNTMAKGKE